MRIIRGKYGKRRFDVPTNITARPTTDFARENIFNVIENIYDLDGCTALDLFAGTGAISFEFASRGCDKVVSVEKSPRQYSFIEKVKGLLKADEMRIVRGDALRYISMTHEKYDIIFADPPYNLPEMPTIPQRILESDMLKPGTLIIVEHGKQNDFSSLPYFSQHRQYGSVNFSIFEIPTTDEAETDDAEEVTND